MGYAENDRVKKPLYVGKIVSQGEDGIKVSFMTSRPEERSVWVGKEKIETVSADQIIVGPIRVSYVKSGIVIRGLMEVKAKWQEYIQSVVADSDTDA